VRLERGAAPHPQGAVEPPGPPHNPGRPGPCGTRSLGTRASRRGD
jgi:hypothetical protein